MKLSTVSPSPPPSCLASLPSANEYQIQALESSMGSSTTQSPWPIFLGIDVGARWSGVPSFSERIQELAHVAKESNTVEVLGFHADTRFASVGASEEDSCSENLEGVLEDTRYFGAEKAVVVPIELAPTYPMISSLTSKTPANVVVEQSAGQAPASIIELHPSNPPLTHLQHVPSKFTEPYHQALRLMTEVCSVYPERNEVLIRTGPSPSLRKGRSGKNSGISLVSRDGASSACLRIIALWALDPFLLATRS